MNKNSNDLEQSWNKLMAELTYAYRGAKIWKYQDGYKWAGRYFKTLQEAKGAIDRSYKVLANSLHPPVKKTIWQRFRFWLLGK